MRAAGASRLSTGRVRAAQDGGSVTLLGYDALLPVDARRCACFFTARRRSAFSSAEMIDFDLRLALFGYRQKINRTGFSTAFSSARLSLFVLWSIAISQTVRIWLRTAGR
jgi:hypothetical protein